jgi:biotin carboxylase
MTDGSGLTARQTANRLWEAGHAVDAVTPDSLCLCRFTRHVGRVRPVPAYGGDPFAWLEAAIEIYGAGGYDVLFPTQEQVAVLAAMPQRLRTAGIATAVPPFGALCAVQDKISAAATLLRLGLPQPLSAVGPDGWDHFPAYVKQPIGTASGGVRRVTSASELRSAAGPGDRVLVQAAVEGPLAMCQAIFDGGALVAFHACERTAEGVSGGASHKTSRQLPDARSFLEVLGRDLGWHGALSADVIMSEGGPLFIDINPRLVEPENAWRSGVDLVGALLEIASGSAPPPEPDSRPDVATISCCWPCSVQPNRERGVVASRTSCWQPLAGPATITQARRN